jgi:phospholipid/cholesterol/gamma-HCH transport system ATP-binding protein
MIEVVGLCKSFDNRQVLDHVSVIFDKGKTNLVIGGSGSGKTVFVKCLVGLFKADAGHIIFDGRDVSGMNDTEYRALRQEMGMVFQAGALFDSMTVEENVAFPLKMFSVGSPSELADRVNFCLKRVNLPNAHKLFPAQLSGGMKKRVAIARAIALNPSYLL